MTVDMENSYDIYDLETGNLVASLPNEALALAMVRRAITEDGPESVECWALGRSDHTAGSIAGEALIAYASNTSAA